LATDLTSDEHEKDGLMKIQGQVFRIRQIYCTIQMSSYNIERQVLMVGWLVCVAGYINAPWPNG